MTRAMLPLALLLLATRPALANPPVDQIKEGRCLELKVDGQAKACNDDFRLVDNGRGEVNFMTGYNHGKGSPKTVVALFTTQAPDMENAYGYALRLSHVTLMPSAAPASQRMWKATGLCFMVKPNPVRAGTQAIRQDIVILCSAHLADPAAGVRRIDWKFVL